MEMASEPAAAHVKTRKQAIIWMWSAHNRVRLLFTETSPCPHPPFVVLGRSSLEVPGRTGQHHSWKCG